MTRTTCLRIVTAITLSRLPLLVLFLVGALAEVWSARPWLAVANLALLAVASLTDLFDGWLARRWKVCTPFGAMVDPLMDKVFYLVVFPVLLYRLAGLGPAEARHAALMLIFTVLYLLRDQWVSFLRALGAAAKMDLRANWMGKLRTAVSFPIGCAVYAYVAWSPAWLPRELIYGLELFGIVLNAASIHVYTRQYLPALRGALQPRD